MKYGEICPKCKKGRMNKVNTDGFPFYGAIKVKICSAGCGYLVRESARCGYLERE